MVQRQWIAEWRSGDPPLTANVRVTEPWILGEGVRPETRAVRLLFTDEVAARTLKPDGTPIEVTTIRWYNAAADTARRDGRELPEGDGGFPAPSGYVRRTTLKGNGRPVVAVTPVWREDKISYWTTHRLGPGGVPRADIAGKKAG